MKFFIFNVKSLIFAVALPYFLESAVLVMLSAKTLHQGLVMVSYDVVKVLA